MRYKALALDLDGTLLTSREEVSPRNLAALASARSAGLQIILASARWYQLAERVARQVESTAPVVACSGAQVRRLDDGHDLFDVRLPQEFADALYAICDAERTIATFALDEHVIVKLDNAPDASLAPAEIRFTTKLTGTVTEQPRIALIQGGDVCRIIEEQLAPAWRDQVHFITSMSSRGKPVLTLTAMGAHKGVALGVACADLGIATEDVVAFGDSDNDIEMFRVAGASVAMGQAHDSLKAAATFVSAPNEEDGVAVAIERLLAEGELRGDLLASPA
jgi:Cof subfamily protein (haloacid dehalogenase superfamily)